MRLVYFPEIWSELISVYPMFKLKKKQVSNLKFSLILFFLLLFGVSSLFLLERAILNLDENLISKNSLAVKSYNIVPEVKGAQVEQPKLINQGLLPPQVSANAVLIQDLETGEILYQKNIRERLSPASTTKLMTALVAIDYYQPSDILEVPSEAQVGGSSMGLSPGEKVSFRSLLYGMLLNSGNDAAYTIALNYPGSMPLFVMHMNKKALELGLNDTNFQNPAGFDGEAHYSSAYDLAKIGSLVANNSQLSKIVSTKESFVSSIDQTHSHNLKNLNILLGENGVIGLKTGFTEKSGENLLGLVEKENKKILTVVLNSNDRFGETKELISWVDKNFSWQ